MSAESNDGITGLLRLETVRVGLTAPTKDLVIRELVDALARIGEIEDAQSVFLAIKQREEMMSTGVGEGIALPHARTSSASHPVAACAVTKHPIEFDSFDNQPVRIVFLLVGPPHATAIHLRILGRVSRLLHQESVRKKMLSARRPAQIITALGTAEAKLLAM